MLSVQVRKQRGEFKLDVAFTASTPGVVALFGRSGCGKSTVVNLIAGLIAADEANITLNQTVLVDTKARLSLPVEARRIGYVFQNARLFPHYSVLKNLTYGATRARGPKLIAQDETIALLGLEALLARRPNQLSGGEQQRVALGRALLSQPQLLLLDEPLASLDVARREELLPYLERLRDRLAIPMVYVSHQFDEVLRLATHVVVLEQGRVAIQGDLGDVSLSPQLRNIVGPDAVGAVLNGTVQAIDADTGLVTVKIGNGVLHIQSNTAIGEQVRVQLLARDIILATVRPQGLSVRNVLHGKITEILHDDPQTDLIFVDIGGATVMARLTRAATQALALKNTQPIWVLIKAASMRSHAFFSHVAMS